MCLPMMRRADEAKCIWVPETMIGGAPGVKVVPAITRAVGVAVMTWPAIVAVRRSGLGFSGTRGTVDVLVPTMGADGPKCIGVPDTVIGGAPGVSVVPAMEMP